MTGFLLAWHGGALPVGRLVALSAVSVLIYAAGLILNDVADVEQDRRERPTRPIPSGRVSRSVAVGVASALLGGGIATAFLLDAQCGKAALLLAVTVVFYDFVAKRNVVLAAFSMGACRGLSVVVGWAAAGAPGLSLVVGVAAVGVTVYIATVTWIAGRETLAGEVGPRRWFPVAVVFMVVVTFVWVAPSVPTLMAGTVAVLYAAGVGVRLGAAASPREVQACVGALIRGLVLLQVFFCMDAGKAGAYCALFLVLMLPVSSRLAKRFYAS